MKGRVPLKHLSLCIIERGREIFLKKLIWYSYCLKINLVIMKKILIVDDEQAVIDGMPKALHKLCDFQGEIKTAKNGGEAIKEISNSFYDICFLDIHLPDLNGLDIMKKIQEISPKTYVVIMTASFITNDIERAIKENGALLIEKPIDLYEVRAFITHILEGNSGLHKQAKFYKKIVTNERRQFERIPFTRHIYYLVPADLAYSEMKLHMKAVIIDIGTGGMGIRTDYPLEPGQHLTFNNVMDHISGIVKWSTTADNNCMAGIMFI